MRRGAYSEMYRAVPTASGTATVIATTAMRIVPTMTAAIPKPPPFGFQVWVVRNEKPALRRALAAR